MPQFTALIVTRRKDGTPATYTLTHDAESRKAMFDYVLDRYSGDSKWVQVESITILEEVADEGT